MTTAMSLNQPVLPEMMLSYLERSKPDLFPLGKTVCTANSLHWAQENLPQQLTETHLWQLILLKAHVTGYWQDMDPEDRRLNLQALEPGNEGRILSAYTLLDQKIYVITEWDRSYTTILLAEDY